MENAVGKNSKLMVLKVLTIARILQATLLLKFHRNWVICRREDEMPQRVSTGCPVPTGSLRYFVLVRGVKLAL